MSSALPEVGADTPLCREVFEGSPSCLHASVRVPSVFPSSCDLPLCPLAMVTHPLLLSTSCSPSVTPNRLSSPDVLFNTNLYNGMTDVFLLGSGLKGTGLQARSTLAAGSFH